MGVARREPGLCADMKCTPRAYGCCRTLCAVPPWRRVQAPASIALPFGTFERVLAADCNASVAAAVAKAERAVVRWRADGTAMLAFLSIKQTLH